MEVKTKLHELRKRRGLSVEKLSQRTGVSSKIIRALERGDRSVDIRSVLTLAQYFRLSTETLLSVCGGGGL